MSEKSKIKKKSWTKSGGGVLKEQQQWEPYLLSPRNHASKEKVDGDIKSVVRKKKNQTNTRTWKQQDTL